MGRKFTDREFDVQYMIIERGRESKSYLCKLMNKHDNTNPQDIMFLHAKSSPSYMAKLESHFNVKGLNQVKRELDSRDIFELEKVIDAMGGK